MPSDGIKIVRMCQKRVLKWYKDVLSALYRDNPAYYQGVDEATKTVLKWFQYWNEMAVKLY